MDFVGSTFKERVIEFVLILSGMLFYHLILRPLNFIQNAGKGPAGPARSEAVQP